MPQKDKEQSHREKKKDSKKSKDKIYNSKHIRNITNNNSSKDKNGTN